MSQPHPFLLNSAKTLAHAIADRQTSAREVLEVHIAHLHAKNPDLNAVVATRLQSARAEADQVDASIRAGQPAPPFAGVPCTVKESFQVQGMPNSSGLVARKPLRAEQDAVTVARLRNAGAIVIGVTNTSELCMWMETDNRVYGRTNNPYHGGHIVGGSSGGEGASVGSGMAPFGLGADVGGSIRMPAFFCGVFGHKPSPGLVPNTGQFPTTTEASRRMLATGPLCRRAEDLWPLVNVLAGPDGEDRSTHAMPLKHPNDVQWSKVKVLTVESDGRHEVDPELVSAQKRAADHFRQLGCTVVEAQFPELRQSFMYWATVFSRAEGRSRFRELLNQPKKRHLVKQLLQWPLGRSEHTLPALTLGLLENLGHRIPRRTQDTIDDALAFKANLHQAIGEHGLLLYPPFPTPAPTHHRPLFPPFQWVYTAIFNVMELCVTQVPLGLSEAGLPLGVQAVSTPGQDHLTIAAALELERKFGGWVPPS